MIRRRRSALLAEAGLPKGFQTSILFGQNFFPGISDFAQTFISCWDAIGVKVRPLEQERAIFTQNFREMNWDMVLSSNPALTLDADYTVGRLYYSANKEMNYANPELDKLLLAAKAESDQNKRKELYAKATQDDLGGRGRDLLGRPEDRLCGALQHIRPAILADRGTYLASITVN